MIKLNRRQLRKIMLETILRESIDGKAREYSMKNPKKTVHLYDPIKSEVTVIKDGENIKKVKAEEGSREYKDYSRKTTKIETFGFGSSVA